MGLFNKLSLLTFLASAATFIPIGVEARVPRVGGNQLGDPVPVNAVSNTGRSKTGGAVLPSTKECRPTGAETSPGIQHGDYGMINGKPLRYAQLSWEFFMGIDPEEWDDDIYRKNTKPILSLDELKSFFNTSQTDSKIAARFPSNLVPDHVRDSILACTLKGINVGNNAICAAGLYMYTRAIEMAPKIWDITVKVSDNSLVASFFGKFLADIAFSHIGQYIPQPQDGTETEPQGGTETEPQGGTETQAQGSTEAQLSAKEQEARDWWENFAQTAEGQQMINFFGGAICETNGEMSTFTMNREFEDQSRVHFYIESPGSALKNSDACQQMINSYHAMLPGTSAPQAPETDNAAEGPKDLSKPE